MIRLAAKSDIEELMNIIKLIIVEMKEAGNHQWDSNYPGKNDFLLDIAGKNLYVKICDHNQIGGFICLDYNEPPEYKAMPWLNKKKALVIHRMGISSHMRHRGLAKELIAFAEDFGKKEAIASIHTDTYSTNAAMNALFYKLDFNLVGQINFKSRPLKFNCYEKELI